MRNCSRWADPLALKPLLGLFISSPWYNLANITTCLDKKYNPELQKRSLENRQGRQEDFNNFVLELKEHSRSDKPSNVFQLVIT